MASPEDLSMFANVLRITFDILLLKRGPQDLPASQTLALGAMLTYFGLNFFLLRSGLPAGQAMLHAFLACGVLALYTHALLRWRQMAARYVQTLAALLVTGIALGLLTVGPMQALQPFLEALATAESESEILVQPPAWAILMYAVAGIWHLVVMGHVFRHALDTTMGRGILFTLLYEIVLLSTIRVANGVMGIQ
jgi:hypothetical protein